MVNNKKKGFTLIELMSVISIIAILAVVLLPNIVGYINRSKKTVVIDQCKLLYRIIELREAEEEYYFNNNEEKIEDLFKVDGSFYNYDLITKDELNKVLEVKLEYELTNIATDSFEKIIKNIEIDLMGKFIKLNN
ncbi:type IV pilin protein [Clostridium saudiense]|uniref:type IV pilin protein n=1 Tax=Clostridium saudiense TaxID=1414720 RepID=UPI0018ABE52C|nr:type II secretion system protein [Clostridium saudiense]